MPLERIPVRHADGPLRNNCWSAVFEPRDSKHGTVVIRLRDECSTTQFICISVSPTGDKYGLTKRKAFSVARALLKELRRE